MRILITASNRKVLHKNLLIYVFKRTVKIGSHFVHNIPWIFDSDISPLTVQERWTLPEESQIVVSQPEGPVWFCHDAWSAGSDWILARCKLGSCFPLLRGVPFCFCKQAWVIFLWWWAVFCRPQSWTPTPRNYTCTQCSHLWCRTKFGPAQHEAVWAMLLVVNGVSWWVRSKRKRRGSVQPARLQIFSEEK